MDLTVTVRAPSFHLPRRQWSLLNRFRTGQGHCETCRKKWGLTDNEMCDCGDIQTTSHIVDSCLLTKLDGGLRRLLGGQKSKPLPNDQKIVLNRI